MEYLSTVVFIIRNAACFRSAFGGPLTPALFLVLGETGEAVLGSPFVRQKINFLVGAWKEVFFCVWCFLVGNGPHGRSLGINTLGGFRSQVFEE
jgi:hypothetical protein